MDGFHWFEENKNLLKNENKDGSIFLFILEDRNKGAKKIGLHHTPYATSSEYLKTSMGIVF